MKRISELCVVTAMVLAVFSVALGATTSRAKDAKHDEAGMPATPPPVSSEPQQTSASFGDWVVRCDRPASTDGLGKRVCEAAQALLIKGQQAPIAQIALGHLPGDKGGDAAMVLTVLPPVSIAFDKPPQLGPGTDDGKATTLTFRRCLPGGCLADARPDAALMATLRDTSKPGRLSFTDAAERTIALPISFRGLPQALDDLAKETGKEASR